MSNKRYIRIYDGKILATENNFVTYSEVETMDGYQLLKSRNKTTEVFLRYTYGSKKAEALIAELKNINKQLFAKSRSEDDGYGHAFEVFAISVLYDLTYEQALSHIVSGKEDGKIDAIYWDDDYVYIYQIKLNSIVNANTMETAKNNFKQFLNNGEIDGSSTSDLFNFLDRNKENIKDKSLKVCSITSDKVSNNNVNASQLFDKYFENRLLPRKKSNISLTIAINDITDPETGYSCKNMTISKNNIFIFAKASQLVESLKSQGIRQGTSDKLFYENVRGFIGENCSMQKTITDNPEKFELYNNGISIIGESKLLPTSILIKNPVVINGQQTLCNLLIANENDINLDSVSVPVFIKTVSDKSEQLNVARFNNTQRQVKDIDILSLNSDIRAIQEALLNKAIKCNFKESNSYYLQIITSGHRTFNNQVKKLFCKNSIISLTDFIRTYWVTENNSLLGDWKNNISKMIYEKIIENNYKFDVEKAISKCRIIKNYKDFLDSIDKPKRQQYQVADVAFIWLLDRHNIDTARKIIDYINDNKYDPKSKSKLIDLYKSNNILNLIEEVKQDLDIQ